MASGTDKVADKVDAIALMKATLPEYVVNCFLAAGYDEFEVITSMDVSSNPGNSIELIEKYISEQNPGDPRYNNNPDSCIKPFQFPPRHEIRIPYSRKIWRFLAICLSTAKLKSAKSFLRVCSYGNTVPYRQI